MRRRTLLAGLATGLASPVLGGQARILRFVPQAAYATPDPVWTSAIIVATHAFMVWDMLYGVDLHLTPHPQMCAGHELSADGLTWTFTIRDGLLFHDGEPVRAADAVASIHRWAERDAFGQRLAGLTAEMTALDDRRLRVQLTAPFPQMLYALGTTCFIMPERMARTPAAEPVKEFVGSGPFRFRTDLWVSGVSSVYERFDRYKSRNEPPDYLAGGKVVNFDRVEWSVQPDPGTAVAALQTGEVDWIDQPLFDLVPVLKRSPGVTVQPLDPFGLIGVVQFNHLQPPFDNPAIRHALLMAVDQHEYVAAVLGDQTQYATLPVGYFTAGSLMANSAGMAALTGPRDRAAARRLIQASGYKGEKALLMSPSDQPQMHAMAEVTASVLQDIGVAVDLVAMDWGTLLTRRTSKKPTVEGGWSAFNTRLSGLGAATPGNGQLRGNGVKGWYGWPTSAALEAAREAWFQAPDLAAQRKASEQTQLAAFEAVPYVPIGQWSQPTAFRSDLSGFVRSSNPLFWGVRRE